MGNGSTDRSPARRHVDAQEDHPLLGGDDADASAAELVVRLIHRKAYTEAAKLAEGRSVLDVGCNDGYGTVLLAARARSAAGVDVSSTAIEAARAREPGGAIDFHVTDGQHLDFPDGSFELVTAFQVIEHVADVSGFLAEVDRVMAPGATLVLTTPNAAIRLDPGMAPWNPFHVHEYTADELRRILAGRFDRVEVEGLFAPEPIAAVEIERSARSRMRARRGRPRIVDAMIRALPTGARLRLRRLAGRDGRVDSGPLRGFDVDDLWYAASGLDRALDLHATCSSR